MAGKYVFGIDLGTTYSAISYVDETGRATVIKNMEGDNTTPSVVGFAGENEVIVGKVAKDNAVIEPDTTVAFVKRLMGQAGAVPITYNGVDKTPEEISAYILKKVTGDAAKFLDTEVKDVVITVPAYFGFDERTATKNAGIIAGLNVLGIINEPTAAAIYYGCTKDAEEKTVLVYDLGGGTFDVTVMRVSSDKIEVVCSDGDHELGGKDWDEALMNYFAEKFCEENPSFDGDFDEYAQQSLRQKAETTKQQLSSREEVNVPIEAAGLRARIAISREKFEELTSMLLDKTIEKTDAAIEIAKGKGYEVDDILLVGGSTKMPQVPKILTEKYGKEPKVLDPDEAVAKGASIHAVNVYINNQKSLDPTDTGEVEVVVDGETKVLDAGDYTETLSAGGGDVMALPGSGVTVVNSTTKSFGIAMLLNGEPKINNLIVKNDPMPGGAVSNSKTYGTQVANQANVELVVYESDFMEEYYDNDPARVEDLILGKAILELPPNLPAGAPIEVTFVLNSEGLLSIKGLDKTGNREVNAEMKSNAAMSTEEIKDIASSVALVEVQ